MLLAEADCRVLGMWESSLQYHELLRAGMAVGRESSKEGGGQPHLEGRSLEIEEADPALLSSPGGSHSCLPNLRKRVRGQFSRPGNGGDLGRGVPLCGLHTSEDWGLLLG